jgi:hypothetical protein
LNARPPTSDGGALFRIGRLEAAIAHQESALVVLDDDLELGQHDTVSNLSSFQLLSTCSAGRRLHSHGEATDRRLSPSPRVVAPGCVRRIAAIPSSGGYRKISITHPLAPS